MNATIIEVKGPDIQTSEFTGKQYDYGSFVRVREDDGTETTFMNGSINQVAPEDRVVGTKGKIVWHKSPSYNLPFFKRKN